MTVRSCPRPAPTPATILQPSVSTWFAKWKAAREVTAAAASSSDEKAEKVEADGRADALARWLTGA